MSGLVDPATQVLGRALDGLSERQSLISSNLANIDTPGYQPQSIDFETALQQEIQAAAGSAAAATAPSAGPSADVALRTTDPRQIASLGGLAAGPSAEPSSFAGSTRNDGNQVDLETEMTALTETQIKYSAVSELLTGKFSQLRSVLGGQ